MIVDLEHKNNEANEKIVSLEALISSLQEELSSSSKNATNNEEFVSMQLQLQELLTEKLTYSESFEQKQSRIAELESEMSHAEQLLSEMENDGIANIIVIIISTIGITIINRSNSQITTARVS